MAIDLDKLLLGIQLCGGRWSDGKKRDDVACSLPIDHDGDCRAAPSRVPSTFNIDAAVAEPGFAPNAWQSKCPDFARDGGSKVPVGASADLTRIVALPRRAQPVEGTPDADKLIAFMTARFSKGVPARDKSKDVLGLGAACRCRELFEFYRMQDPETGELPECITELRLIQAWSLLEIMTKRGLLAPIGVGHGKSMLDLLTPLAMPECKEAVLLVPPRNVGQIGRDYKILGQHFHMPTIAFHDSKHAGDSTRSFAGAPRLHVYPYSLLSRPENSADLEERLRPDTIIADEAHKLKAANTATTGRVLRYFKAHPECRFTAWSGSLTDKSIKEYAHLSALALRLGSPLPIKPETVDDWARAIDPPGKDASLAPEGALIALCNEGEHIHKAFHRRLVETPGVVATKNASVSAELVILEREAPPIPTVGSLFVPPLEVAKKARMKEGEAMSVNTALNLVRRRWTRPDGHEYPDALQRAAGLIQIACGFFYRWRYPFVHGRPQNIATIIAWTNARKDWNKEVRSAIRSRREHFDSEKLARNAAERAYGDRPITKGSKLPVWHAESYPLWKELEHTVKYETEAVWLDEFLAADAAEWAREHRGLMWYAMSEFGEKVAELSGLPMFGGGTKSAALLQAHDGKSSVIVSILANGTGVDGLQFKYSDQLVGNPGSSNYEWEQMLGRLHRVGQRKDCVTTAFYRHTPEIARKTNQALRRAGYVETTIGSAQKLNLSGMTYGDEELDDIDDFADFEE